MSYRDPFGLMAARLRHEEFFLRARSLGVSAELAEQELAAVVREAQQIPQYVDVYSVALHRMTLTLSGQPAEEVRTVIRAVHAASRWSLHPEVIDRVARCVSPRTKADELLDHLHDEERRGR